MNKKLRLLALVVMSMFIFIGKVNAEEYSIDVSIGKNATGDNINPPLTMTLNGNLDSSKIYYVKLVNSGDAKPSITSVSSAEDSSTDITRIKAVNKDTKEININADWYMLNGYDNAYVVECAGTNSCSVVNDTPIKIEKPKLPSYTNRYKIIFVAKNLQAYSCFPDGHPFGTNGSHKKIIKLGKITDSNVIRKMAKSESDAVSSLMNYAKSADGETFEISDTKLSVDTSKVVVDANAYYYVYTTYENSDGMYRDLSDVTIAQGYMNNGNALLTTDVKYNISDDSKSSVVTYGDYDVVKNPQTSDMKTIIITVVLLIGGIFVILGRKKLKKISK